VPSNKPPGSFGGGRAILPRWLRALFAWRTVRETGVYAYQQNDVTSDRRAIRLTHGCHSPLDREWLSGGEITAPPRPPPPEPLFRRSALPAHVSIFPHFNVYAPMPRGKDLAMRTSAKVEKPQDVDVTISITMPVSEWDKLRLQLSAREWPAARLDSAIIDAISKIRRTVYGDVPEEVA
jgi:hypothetical protein